MNEKMSLNEEITVFKPQITTSAYGEEQLLLPKGVLEYAKTKSLFKAKAKLFSF